MQILLYNIGLFKKGKEMNQKMFTVGIKKIKIKKLINLLFHFLGTETFM